MAIFLKALLLFFLMSVAFPVQAQDVERVEQISVSVASPKPIAPALQIRLENSLATVTRQMLNGKNLPEVRLRSVQYERILQEVFNRVLFGYEVDQVKITPGRELQVAMQVTPWGDLVENVEVQVEYGNVPLFCQPLIEKDLGGVREIISNLFLGLPVDSEEWALGVAKTELRERLVLQLPEYDVNIDLSTGVSSVVKLTLLPKGPLIYDSRVKLQTENLPNLLLLDLKKEMTEEITSWRSLPATWVDRHKSFFTQRLLNKAKASPLTKRYDLRYRLEWRADPVAEVFLLVTAEGYKINAEGYLDVGRKEGEASARLHIGRMLSTKDEVFFETDVYPKNFTWKFSLGLGRHFGKDTDVGVQYLFSDRQAKLWLHQKIATDWQLHLERYPKTSESEIGLRYRVHEFLSVEYVFTKQENWLRLIGVL